MNRRLLHGTVTLPRRMSLSGWSQGAFVVLLLQRAKPNSSVATTTSTHVSVSFFDGIMLSPHAGPSGRMRPHARRDFPASYG